MLAFMLNTADQSNQVVGREGIAHYANKSLDDEY